MKNLMSTWFSPFEPVLPRLRAFINRIARPAITLVFVATWLSLTAHESTAWSLHYLITDQSLTEFQSPSLNLAEVTVVKPFDEFLKSSPQDLKLVFDRFYDWLDSRPLKRYKRQTFDAAHPTQAEFLKAARLNPKTQLKLVTRVLPSEPQNSKEIPGALHQVVGASKTENPEFEYRFAEVQKNQTVSVRSELITFCDEPDWGMDQDLFQIAEYGYGKIPYGGETGIPSQAPFHMLFLTENFIVKFAAPEALEGMGRERVELFSRLSQFAFAHNERYWGFRFAGWALHYLQDLGQPYHSRAMPHWTITDYLKFAVSSEKEKIKKDATQLVKNRHFAYEDLVAHALQAAYFSAGEFEKALAVSTRAEAKDFSVNPGPSEKQSLAVSLVEIMSRTAGAHSHVIDAVLVDTLGQKYTNDPAYDLQTDKDYQIKTLLPRLDQKKLNHLLQETQVDFSRVGAITRAWVESLVSFSGAASSNSRSDK